jgi:hypothetical protein
VTLHLKKPPMPKPTARPVAPGAVAQRRPTGVLIAARERLAKEQSLQAAAHVFSNMDL